MGILGNLILGTQGGLIRNFKRPYFGGLKAFYCGDLRGPGSGYPRGLIRKSYEGFILGSL